MAAPTATRNKVRYRIVDVSATSPLLADATTLDEAIAAAVSRYSQDRPRTVVANVSGTGSEYYALTGGSPVLASWSDGASRIVSIDHPAHAVAAGVTPTWLDPDTDWAYYRDASIVYLRFLSGAPAVGETARVTYTAPHTHTSVTDTVPAGDLDALCDLAAYYACLELATKAAASQDSVIAADSTNYRDGQLRFRQQADAWLASYNQRLGLRTDGKGGSAVAGASANADWNRPATTGYPWLTHSRRWR